MTKTIRDRESELIKAVTDLVKIINGIQDSISHLTECCALLKERVEKLEGKI